MNINLELFWYLNDYWFLIIKAIKDINQSCHLYLIQRMSLGENLK